MLLISSSSLFGKKEIFFWDLILRVQSCFPDWILFSFICWFFL
uniref:Uncharacterized protein n=1 Tax=Arundo donax TaxID=35708 RepID=A0A0A9AAZ8_ARUDO